ncbi:MAG: hypothetical protein KBI46_01715 [Phycisphaerae bacterium]|nr:hypothetical protein [Phycisphaerae bacterium]
MRLNWSSENWAAGKPHSSYQLWKTGMGQNHQFKQKNAESEAIELPEIFCCNRNLILRLSNFKKTYFFSIFNISAECAKLFFFLRIFDLTDLFKMYMSKKWYFYPFLLIEIYTKNYGINAS